MDKRSFSVDYWDKSESRVEFFVSKLLPTNIPITAVKIFDICDNELVLVNTPKGWDIPGGHLEKNETAIQALKREVYEETCGVIEECTIVGYLMITKQKVNEHNKNYPKKSVIAIYSGRIVNISTDAMSLSHESIDVKKINVELLSVAIQNWSDLYGEIIEYIKSI
jgi:hypothetical protein